MSHVVLDLTEYNRTVVAAVVSSSVLIATDVVAPALATYVVPKGFSKLLREPSDGSHAATNTNEDGRPQQAKIAERHKQTAHHESGQANGISPTMLVDASEAQDNVNSDSTPLLSPRTSRSTGFWRRLRGDTAQRNRPRVPETRGERDWRVWSLAWLGCVEATSWTIGSVARAIARKSGAVQVVLMLIVALSWWYVAVRPLVRPPRSAPLLLFVFYLGQAILLVLQLITLGLHGSHWTTRALAIDTVLTSLHGVVIISALSLILGYRLSPHEPMADVREPISDHRNEKDVITMRSPEEDVTLGAWIIFSWVAPIIARGQKNKLGYSDVWQLPDTMAAAGVRRSASKLKSRRLIPRILYNNSLDLILSLSLGLLSSSLSYIGPFFLQRILRALSPQDPTQPYDSNLRKSAYIYALLAFVAQIARAEVDLQQLWHERRAIIRCRTGLMTEVYEKALKRRDLSGVISKQEEAGFDASKTKGKKGASPPAGVSTGKVVNMMSTDVNKIANQLMNLSSIVAAPFELVVAVTFLYQLLGWPAIAGLSIMLISLPVNHVLSKRRIHRSVLASRDRRMEVLNEFIQAIRFVKYSASEEQWLERTFKARNEELGWLLKTRLNYLLINIVWTFSPDAVCLIAFTFFTKVRGQQLDVATAFTALALFALVRAPMNLLPSAINQLLQNYVAVQRLEAFFKEPEVEAWASGLKEDEVTNESDQLDGKRVAIVDGYFKYQDMTTGASASETTPAKADTIATKLQSSDSVAHSQEEDTNEHAADEEEQDPFALRDISIEFPVGQLTLVSGPTGSGKTSIFLALLGEMDRVGGQVILRKGTHTSGIEQESGLYDGVAYTSQLPWLQHASIKNNILFGSAFEEDRYEAVLDACALRADLALFDAGDETEIGERGISLSGGQKARVALARAVYSRARTVMLDDPLSAVDAHVAKHLYKKCLKGPLLENRTVILVTHHISLCLPGAFYLVRMSAGRVEMQSLVSELDTSDLAEEYQLEKLEAAKEAREAAKAAKKKAQAEEIGDAEQTAAAAVQEGKSTGSPAQVPREESQNPTRAGTPIPNERQGPRGDGKLVQEEARAEGRVKGAVYRLYLSAAGYHTWIAIVLLILAGRGFRVVDRVWFKYWGESYQHSSTMSGFVAMFVQQNAQMAMNKDSHGSLDALALPHLPPASENVNPYLAVYALICLANLSINVASILVGFYGSFRAARSLFTRTLTRVVYAPFRYFDVTPSGRLLNRFSGDIQTIDTSITDQVRTCMTHAFSFIVNVGVIVLVSPKFIPPAVIIVYCYVRLSLQYVRCSRDLRRLESNARSPIFSKFGETLQGIATCRAFSAERRFLQGLFSSVDKMLAVNYASAMINRYLLWRFDCLGAVAVSLTTFLALFAGASPGLAALAITSAQSLVQSIYWLCRFTSALETDLNAVERVTELLEVPQEPPQITDVRPPAIWPSDAGGIAVEDLVIQYAETLPAVIKNVSFEVKPRESIGVVGRTGSGKSTLALSLLRFTEPTSGKIIIDGIDVTKIGLNDLRSRLTFIPQEAVLFSGTIRSNLDPFEEHSDQECLDALARVRMIAAPLPPSARASREGSRAPTPPPQSTSRSESMSAHAAVLEAHGHLAADTASVASAGASSSNSTKVDVTGRISVTLDTAVSAGGHNFSAGQRQLLAMARALLKRSRIIIMDEATASVDMETDAKIQHTIQEEFADNLVITIAHRLMTVVDYDKVLVLEKGQVAEYASPKELMQKQDGLFRKMCAKSADWEALRAKVGLKE
ncbi:hypothetical protein OIO90_003870 [Microbotryomycetes sp. JL221]|nr:hypothetical protein OIO90_003870 [Microbotryomycetes sp. JL221]